MIDKLPHKIRFAPRKHYGVSMVSGFDDNLQMGECDPNTKQIKLKSGMGDKITVSVLTHEIIHLLSIEGDLSLTESQVEAVEIGFIRVLELNPSYLRLLHSTLLKRKPGGNNAK